MWGQNRFATTTHTFIPNGCLIALRQHQQIRRQRACVQHLAVGDIGIDGGTHLGAKRNVVLERSIDNPRLEEDNKEEGTGFMQNRVNERDKERKQRTISRGFRARCKRKFQSDNGKQSKADVPFVAPTQSNHAQLKISEWQMKKKKKRRKKKGRWRGFACRLWHPRDRTTHSARATGALQLSQEGV